MTEETTVIEQSQPVVEDAAALESQNVEDNNSALAKLDAEIAGKPLPEEEKTEDAPEAEAEGEETEEAEETTEEIEQPQKKVRKPGEVTRLREKAATAAAEKEAATARATKAERDLIELQQLVQDKFLTAPKKEDDFQPLDPEADAKYKAEIAKLNVTIENQPVMMAIKQEDMMMGMKDPQWNTKKDFVIAEEAHRLRLKKQATNDKEALAKAGLSVGKEIYDFVKSGGSVADYINPLAAKVMANLNSATSGKQKASASAIDMAELDNLRQSAGAPTNKVASVKMAPEDMLAKIDAEIAASSKKQSASVW